jgi:hypothetical protein
MDEPEQLVLLARKHLVRLTFRAKARLKTKREHVSCSRCVPQAKLGGLK